MEELERIPVILDGDPGHDDAVAWVLAQASGRFDILAVTTTAGNSTLEKTTYNALRVCALTGINAPVAMGSRKGLMTEPMNAPSVHGESGLDGPVLPEPISDPVDMSACELMAKVVSESDKPVTIISTGPMTNTAIFLTSHPELKNKIERISLVGGGLTFGNWTPAAEFNILVDPEAAKICYESGIPILMTGINVTEQALIKAEDISRIRALGNPVSDIVWQWIEFFYIFHRNLGYEGAPVHDPCAVLTLICPEAFTFKDYYVEIETSGDYCKGATIPDVYGVTGKKPNARCSVAVDRKMFVDCIVDAISRYGEAAK